MKTVMVTGASGLIGKAIIEMLVQKGYNVIATDKTPNKFEYEENFKYYQSAIFDKDMITNIIQRNKIDVLIHAACTVDNDFPDILSQEEEKDSAAVDKYLFRTAESSGISDIIMLSTHQVYAPQKTREPIRETAGEKPISIYGKLKLESEKALANCVRKSQRTNGVIMRLCPVYTKDFTENLKSKVYDTKEGCAFVYGYGDYGYTFTCVYNVVDFIYGILTCPGNITYQGVYNVCDSKPITAKEIVEALRNEHKIGAVVSRNYSTEAVKSTTYFFATKAEKTEYRFFDVGIACSNITYDNTKAQRISTFRWKLSNTK